MRRGMSPRWDTLICGTCGGLEVSDNDGPVPINQVRELLSATNHARGWHTTLPISAGGSCGSRTEKEGQEAENRNAHLDKP